MVRNIFKALRTLLGAISILFGIIGLVIPIVQGWFFILAGLFLINPEYYKKGKEKIKLWVEKRRRKRTLIEEELM